MAWVAWQLGRASVIDWPTVSLFVACSVALLRFRVNSAWLVLGSGAAGLFFRG
jgi:chromate transporter